MRCARQTFVTLLLGAAVATSAFASPPVLVTGRPASRGYLRQVLGARGWKHLPTAQLPVGGSWTSPDGDQVINVDWTSPEAAIAALSDHPEEVDRMGLLFSGGLTALKPVRLQYYHLGELEGADPQVTLWVTNSGNAPATLHVAGAAGKPSKDYFSTGHGNNVAWFGAEMRGEGEFVEIPAGQTVAVFRQDMPRECVISGTLGLTAIQGPPLQFDLVASPDFTDTPLAFNNLLKESDVHSRGFYPVASQRLRGRHVVGQAETRIAVGALRQATFSGVRELRGDYGVVYDVEIALFNPLKRSATVDVLFNPRGGAATGTFLLGGKVIEVPRTEAKAEAPITTVELPAGAQRSLRLRTIPEGASSYPVRIVVRDHP